MDVNGHVSESSLVTGIEGEILYIYKLIKTGTDLISFSFISHLLAQQLTLSVAVCSFPIASSMPLPSAMTVVASSGNMIIASSSQAGILLVYNRHRTGLDMLLCSTQTETYFNSE